MQEHRAGIVAGSYFLIRNSKQGGQDGRGDPLEETLSVTGVQMENQSYTQ